MLSFMWSLYRVKKCLLTVLIGDIRDVSRQRVGHSVGDDLPSAVGQTDPVLPPGVAPAPLLLLPEVLAGELVPHPVGELVVGRGLLGGESWSQEEREERETV